MRDLKNCEGSQKMWGISKNLRDLKSLEIAPNPSHSIYGMKKKCWSVWFCETIKHALFLKSHPPNLRRIPGKMIFQWQWLQSIGYLYKHGNDFNWLYRIRNTFWDPFWKRAGWSECFQMERSFDVFLRRTVGDECFQKIIARSNIHGKRI